MRKIKRKLAEAADAITFGFFAGLGIIAAGAVVISVERLVSGGLW